MRDLNRLTLDELFNELIVDSPDVAALLDIARREDLNSIGDVTTASLVAPDQPGEAVLTARQNGVVSGLPLVRRILKDDGIDGSMEPAHQDGDSCRAGDTLAVIRAPLAAILTAERRLLNFVGHLSGVATITAAYVSAVAGTNAVICDTRKTTPGWRHLEKYAVRCGGGTLHRMGLYDAALYKDNHLAGIAPAQLAAKLADAARAVRANHDLQFVEVEVDTLDQLQRVLEIEPGLIDLILLDNMSLDDLQLAVCMTQQSPAAIKLEASGGITLETVADIAATGVDRISVGAITHSALALDLGLDIKPS